MRERIRAALLLEGLDDVLSLGWVEARIALVAGGSYADSGLFEKAMEAIRDLLELDYVVAGPLVKEPVSNQDRDFKVWLELTAKGRAEAKRLEAAGCDPFPPKP